MAIPLMAVLKAIPWGQVIENAPQLVDGAQKLFSRLKKDKERTPDVIVPDTFSGEDEGGRLLALERYVQENRLELKQLYQNLSDTADLLNHLTGQNAKMVDEIDLLRRQTRRLQRMLVAVSIVLTGIALRYFFG